jgi:hypothetical protein
MVPENASAIFLFAEIIADSFVAETRLSIMPWKESFVHCLF